LAGQQCPLTQLPAEQPLLLQQTWPVPPQAAQPLPAGTVPARQANWQVPLLQVPTLSCGGVHWLFVQQPWQTPLHMKRLPLHLRSHRVPSQVAVAPFAVGHEPHEDVPHEFTLLLSLHSLPQR
jgi:hypothetical protein